MHFPYRVYSLRLRGTTTHNEETNKLLKLIIIMDTNESKFSQASLEEIRLKMAQFAHERYASLVSHTVG